MDSSIPKSETEKVTGNPGEEVEIDFPQFIRVYKDGRVERFMGMEAVPTASSDPAMGVSSKDVPIIPDLGVFARLFLPKDTQPGKKLPVLVYYHGGAFCIGSARSPTYHGYLTTVVSRCGVVAVSVNYRLAPEHRLPAAYDDSWEALKWVAAAAGGGRREGDKEPWLEEHADLRRVFIAGDSAGGNICHWIALKAGQEEEEGGTGLHSKVEIEGMVLVHPYFWGKEPIGSETTDPGFRNRIEKVWKFVCSQEVEAGKGTDHPWMNPWVEGTSSATRLGCRRVLICAAERDFFRDRSWLYYDRLKECGWPGMVEIMEITGEDHVFHLIKPSCDGAMQMLDRLAAFINSDAA